MVLTDFSRNIPALASEGLKLHRNIFMINYNSAVYSAVFQNEIFLPNWVWCVSNYRWHCMTMAVRLLAICSWTTAALLPPGLTHCGLVMPYGGIDWGQHWLRWWLVAWRHQAITWTNVGDSLMRCCGIHLRAILHRVPKLLFHTMNLKIILLKLLPHPPKANELTH